MKISLEFQNHRLRVPENCNELPVRVIVGDGGSGPEPGPGEDRIAQLVVTETVRRESSFIVNAEV